MVSIGCTSVFVDSETVPRRKKTIPAPAPISDRHRDYQLPARVKEPLREALVEVAHEERRSISQIVTILLEESLTVRGKWPRHEAN